MGNRGLSLSWPKSGKVEFQGFPNEESEVDAKGEETSESLGDTE